MGDDDLRRALELLVQHRDVLGPLLGAPQVHVPQQVVPSKSPPLTVRSLWRRYWEDEGFALDTAHTEKARMESRGERVGALDVEVSVAGALRKMGDLLVEEMTVAVIKSLRTALAGMTTRYKRPFKPATINRIVCRFARMFEWATEPQQRYIAVNPIRKVPRLKEDNVKRGKIAKEDSLAYLLTFWDASKAKSDRKAQALHVVRFLVLGFIDTGMRRMELINLQWDHVDLATGRVSLLALDRKNDRPLAPILTPRALAALKNIPRVDGCPYVCANLATKERYDPTYLYRVFEDGVTKSGMQGPAGENITWHTLRHSFAYKARVQWKLPQRTVREMLGQKTDSAFERYGIVDQEEIDMASEARDVAIARATAELEAQRKGPHGAGLQVVRKEETGE